MGYIYKITNKLNNKLYIGLTTKARPTDRFSQHRYAARHLQNEDHSYLHRAMAQDGVDNFIFEIIEETDDINLPEREQYWITFYNTFAPNGYNLTEGGEGTSGYCKPHTQETREKIQNSLQTFYDTHPEEKDKIRQRTKKLWENPEYREKVTESNIKFYSEHPDKFKGENNPFYGKTHTAESIEKIRKKLPCKAIQQLDKETYEVITTYSGVKEAERALGVSHGWISKAANQNKIAYGYRWKFIESVTTNSSSEISTEQSGEPSIF